MLYPEAFPLADLSTIDTYLIKGKEEFLQFSNNIFLYQGSGLIEDLGKIPDEEYSKLQNFSDDTDFIIKYINHKTGNNPFYINNASLQTYIDYDYNAPEEYIKIHKDNLSREMLKKLKEEANKFINHLDKEASYYAKDAFRYVYSDLDFSSVIKVVNNEDFEYCLL